MRGLTHAVFRRGQRAQGQSLAEFALIAPLAIAMLAGIIQFGTVFWGQNTLTQVVRDTGRWAATQQNCSTAGLVGAQAQTIAGSSSLIGYNKTTNPLGVTVTWDSATCPIDNTTVNYVHVTATAKVPTFFPGMQYLPQLGTCNSSGCTITLSSTAQFRMEPKP